MCLSLALVTVSSPSECVALAFSFPMRRFTHVGVKAAPGYYFSARSGHTAVVLCGGPGYLEPRSCKVS